MKNAMKTRDAAKLLGLNADGVKALADRGAFSRLRRGGRGVSALYAEDEVIAYAHAARASNPTCIVTTEPEDPLEAALQEALAPISERLDERDEALDAFVFTRDHMMMELESRYAGGYETDRGIVFDPDFALKYGIREGDYVNIQAAVEHLVRQGKAVMSHSAPWFFSFIDEDRCPVSGADECCGAPEECTYAQPVGPVSFVPGEGFYLDLKSEPVDPEVLALDQVRAALEPLDNEQRIRVTEWAIQRFEIRRTV